MRVPTAGGESHLLIPDGFGIRPSPDGKWLAYLEAEKRRQPPRRSQRHRPVVHIRPVEGGEGPHAAALPPGSRTPGSPGRPDSRELLVGGGAYSRAPHPSTRVPIDGSAPSELDQFAPRFQKLGFSSLSVSRLTAWFADGSIAVPARFGDAVNLFRIPLPLTDKAMPTALTAAPLDNSDPCIVGNRVVFSHRDYQQEIWSLPADVNAGRVTGPMRRISTERVEAQFPDVRPDGTKLVYHSRRFGVPGVFLLDLATGRDRMLLHSDLDYGFATLSPGGTRLAVASGVGNWKTWTIPTSGGELTPIAPAYGRLRGWTPDGPLPARLARHSAA